ncbi:MAG: hypothetical protein ACR2OJ_05495 [Hyphomicrobiales bacterium]
MTGRHNFLAQESAWETSSASALGAYLGGQRGDAKKFWMNASLAAEVFDQNDPRNATHQNNIGIVEFLSRDFDAAYLAFGHSVELWVQSNAWIEGMSISGAKSSLHHMRLEQRHRYAFDGAKRERFAHLSQGACAIAQFNLGITARYLGRTDEADRLVETAAKLREKMCGFDDSELAKMKSLLASIDKDSTRRAVNRPEHRFDNLAKWRFEQKGGIGDERRFLSAVYLTALMDQSVTP